MDGVSSAKCMYFLETKTHTHQTTRRRVSKFSTMYELWFWSDLRPRKRDKSFDHLQFQDVFLI